MPGPRLHAPRMLAAAVIAALALGAPAVVRAETRLSLVEAITLARKHRAEIADADLDSKLARLALLRAGLKRFRLAVDGRASEQVEQLYVNAPAGLCASVEGLCQPAHRARIYDVSARLDIPIWTGFGLEAEWTRARKLERAARADKQARLRALDLEVAGAYWTVRLAELQREAAGRALERRRQMAALVKARTDGGIAPRTDANRLEISALRQQAAVAELDGRIREARAELASVLQIEVDGQLVLTDGPEADSGGAASPLAALLDQAQRRRPELDRAQAELEAQQQQVRAIKGALWPELGLFARAEAQNQAFGLPQPRLIGHFAAGLTLSWLAFDGLLTYQAARAAEVERDRLALGRERLRHTVAAEVRAAHGRLEGARTRRAPLTEGLALARTTLELVRRRYQAGAALLIEVLEAEDQLYELETDTISNAIDIAEARAAVAAAGGAGGAGS